MLKSVKKLLPIFSNDSFFLGAVEKQEQGKKETKSPLSWTRKGSRNVQGPLLVGAFIRSDGGVGLKVAGRVT